MIAYTFFRNEDRNFDYLNVKDGTFKLNPIPCVNTFPILNQYGDSNSAYFQAESVRFLINRILQHTQTAHPMS